MALDPAGARRLLEAIAPLWPQPLTDAARAALLERLSQVALSPSEGPEGEESRALEHHLQPILEAIIGLASLDFSVRVPLSGTSEAADAIAAGINMLAEEIAARTAEERDLRARLMHIDRLAAAGQLASGVAHEVNNPATFVLANLSVLAERNDRLKALLEGLLEGRRTIDRPGVVRLAQAAAPRETNELLNECIEGMNRIVSMVKDLRTFSRADSTTEELVDVNDLIRIAAKMVGRTLAARARVMLDLHPLPRMLANSGRLTQALTNLLLNAAQAIAEGAPEKNSILVATRTHGDEVVVQIEDTGVGMSPEVQRRIFEPFFTTKSLNQGAGLGLALTADIVHQHAGSITFRSQLDLGTTFEMRLPVRTPEAPIPTPQARAASLPAAVRLLLVDDEPMVLKAYRRALRGPYEVTAAGSGAEAIALVERGDDFDAVVCDVMMPNLDGPAVFEAVSKLHPTLAARFVFISGGVFTQRTREFLATHPGRVLEKPVDFKVLASTIASLCSPR